MCVSGSAKIVLLISFAIKKLKREFEAIFAIEIHFSSYAHCVAGNSRKKKSLTR